MLVGYARVSSSDQDYETQVKQLKKLGCKRIFSEKSSGKNRTDRPEFNRMMEFVRQDDVVVVMKTDRIARNLRDANWIADTLADKGVGLKLMDLGDLDINKDMGRMIYVIMSTFASMERERILERQKEGIALAKQRGVRLGRPPKIDEECSKKILTVYLEVDGNVNKTAKTIGVSRNSVYKILRANGL